MKMKSLSFSAVILFLFCGCTTTEVNMPENIYGFSVKDIDGKTVQLENYRGNVLLIVNTAGRCGFTPQYEGLENLYTRYRDRGFFVLAFPCNQFAGQEPGDNQSIKKFCSVNYGVTFPVFAKIEVNSEKADPLFKYLKHAQGGFFTDSIKWNFTKFLVSREGVPVARYAPVTKPAKIAEDIERELDTGTDRTNR